MVKYLLITLLPLCLMAEMKCAEGKCGSDMSKNIPKVEKANTSMKCESGKCESGKDISLMKHTKITKKVTVKQLFNVTTVQVREQSLSKKQVNYGYVVIPDDNRVDVTAWYAGFVEELYIDKLYMKVTKGDPLVKIYSPEVYQAKQDYLNSLNYNTTRSAPAMLKSAMTKLRLLGVSQKEITQIQKEKKANEYTTIYAPSSGWIFKKNINQGSAIMVKSKLFEIVNLKQVWVEAKIFQEQLTQLDTFKHFSIKAKGIEKTYKANKSLLYPILNPKEATSTLRLIVENNDTLLKPGMYVKIYASNENTLRLTIPRTAVVRKGAMWYAFLATEFKGEYEPIAIEIKPLDNTYYEVIKGLTLDDVIVNNALFMMDSDAQINSIY